MKGKIAIDRVIFGSNIAMAIKKTSNNPDDATKFFVPGPVFVLTDLVHTKHLNSQLRPEVIALLITTMSLNDLKCSEISRKSTILFWPIGRLRNCSASCPGNC